MGRIPRCVGLEVPRLWRVLRADDADVPELRPQGADAAHYGKRSRLWCVRPVSMRQDLNRVPWLMSDRDSTVPDLSRWIWLCEESARVLRYIVTKGTLARELPYDRLLAEAKEWDALASYLRSGVGQVSHTTLPEDVRTRMSAWLTAMESVATLAEISRDEVWDVQPQPEEGTPEYEQRVYESGKFGYDAQLIREAMAYVRRALSGVEVGLPEPPKTLPEEPSDEAIEAFEHEYARAQRDPMESWPFRRALVAAYRVERQGREKA